MSYEHGISIQESSTVTAVPKQTSVGVQVVIGTAPVNLLDKPSAAVNVPILVKDYDEAVAAVGYSDDWNAYTLCQAIDASFKQFGVGPLVLINVLDPGTHVSLSVTDTVNITNGIAKVDALGVLLDSSFIVKDSAGTTTYELNKDYTVAFDKSGYPNVSVISGGAVSNAATSLKVTYTKLDPSKVNTSDIIGGYTASTNTYKGIECIRQVYPKFNLVPAMIIAPGWSHKKDVAAALRAKNVAINGCFNSEIITDIDCSAAKVNADVIAWKASNGYNSNRELVLWPKVKIDGKIYWYSSVLAALIAYNDAQNGNVPFKSPSNKKLPICSTVLADGSEVFLDQVQANELNGHGIITAINMAGWRVWGNNTAAYPDNTDPKDRWIAVRRVFDWWGNNFIVDFFDKVDEPTNYRLIESIVDEENIKANGYQAAGQIAGAKISFDQADNSVENILNGQIKFKQTLGAFTPAENIINVLQFDPTLVSAAISGGDK